MITTTMDSRKPKNLPHSTTASTDTEETLFNFSYYSTATMKRVIHRYVLFRELE